MTATPKPKRPPSRCIPLTVVWQVCPCCGELIRLHLGGQAWLVPAERNMRALFAIGARA